MKNWLSEFSGNDLECERKIRDFLKQDKKFIKEINIAYREKKVVKIRKMIENYLMQKGMIVRKCKNCDKKTFISTKELRGKRCENCNHLLLITESKKKQSKQVKEGSNEFEGRKCIRCGGKVSSLNNSMTCYSCRRIQFEY